MAQHVDASGARPDARCDHGIVAVPPRLWSSPFQLSGGSQHSSRGRSVGRVRFVACEKRPGAYHRHGSGVLWLADGWLRALAADRLRGGARHLDLRRRWTWTLPGAELGPVTLSRFGSTSRTADNFSASRTPH